MCLINTRETLYNRSSHTVICSNLPWSSLVKYSYDEFKSGKIIFKEFNSSIRFSPSAQHCHLSWREWFLKRFHLRSKPKLSTEQASVSLLFYLFIYFFISDFICEEVATASSLSDRQNKQDATKNARTHIWTITIYAYLLPISLSWLIRDRFGLAVPDSTQTRHTKNIQAFHYNRTLFVADDRRTRLLLRDRSIALLSSSPTARFQLANE